ncbi:MAG: Nramp family divalent metal transporter [Alphaproteobacteria bacterium]|nr:Nramp family divalent metal transporter [Alphaproteobacteria bacterium]MCB9690634.1 Nramp family divalent metal transporter [Alphaproteobacteria bacterium]
MSDRQPLWKSLGPGLVWAGTAVGVSHLVQSTRAGAGYGLSLVLLVVAANLFKYPAYEAGPRYAAATGTSLLEGYRRRGTWALVLFLLLTISTMFTVVAAVTFVAAGMAGALVTDAIPVWGWSAILLAFAIGMLLSGGFRVLERFMTAMMLLLTASTVFSVLLVLPTADLAAVPAWPPFPPLEGPHLLFVAALVGWMPSALDTAVWHSQWALEKERTEGVKLTREGARLDFDVGYIGTTVLAVLFVFLGASLLYGRELPGSSIAFATLLVDTYTSALGAWARPLILVAAFSTMLSTTVAVTDGFPRALEGAVERLKGAETAHTGRTWVYVASLFVVAGVAQLICVFFTGQLKALVDLATALTGLTAPAFAVLNLATLRGDEVPEDVRPRGLYLAFHLAGIVFLVAMALLYLWARALVA